MIIIVTEYIYTPWTLKCQKVDSMKKVNAKYNANDTFQCPNVVEVEETNCSLLYTYHHLNCPSFPLHTSINSRNSSRRSLSTCIRTVTSSSAFVVEKAFQMLLFPLYTRSSRSTNWRVKKVVSFVPHQTIDQIFTFHSTRHFTRVYNRC